MEILLMWYRKISFVHSNKYQCLAILFLAILASCKTAQQTYQATSYPFPDPVDTETKPISLQDKQIFNHSDFELYARNDFPGARLNDFTKLNDSTFQVTISAENEPINPSPWYAFKLWSRSTKNFYVRLHYVDARHRYPPKLSPDGSMWEDLDSMKVATVDSTDVVMNLSVGPDTLWVAGQEIMNSLQVKAWAEELATHPEVEFQSIGSSKLGRPLYAIDIGPKRKRKKETIVLLSRQHPPEVTGFMALQSFLDKILDSSAQSNQFRSRYRILVFPLMNPDGVDLGHWRHNAGGIDLNRDWQHYHQPETKQVADYLVTQTRRNKSQVILGLDFHSTYYDVYYTNTLDSASVLPNFTKQWLQRIGETIPDYEINERPSGVGKPVSKGWFYTQFNAVGVTYEIGDKTPRDFIRLKGAVSAEKMMEVLLEE
ncbi:MAG: M14 family metallopeptidase [Cyclobacteriaceae bacterium]